MAKVKGKDAVAAQAEREYIEEHLSILYEVGLSIQVSVDGAVPAMTEDKRREVLLLNVLDWLSAAGEFSIPDPAAAARKILKANEEIYDGEEIVDVTVT